MTNYFESVGSKSSLKSKEIFSNEDSEPELLPNYLKKRRPIEANLERIERLFTRWCGLLFYNGYNIVVQGRQSKFRLLETFKARYLDSCKIPDLKCTSPSNGSSCLNVTTIRMHGFTPVKSEQFNFAVLGTTKASGDNVEQFLARLRKTRNHHVFLLHSFELLYRESRDVCDLIFQFYHMEPEHIHIIFSSDHANSGIILGPLKAQLQLIHFHLPYGESFFYEKSSHVCIMDTGDDTNDGGLHNQAARLFDGQLSLQSLKDVYQALQENCKKIMVHIISRFIEMNRLLDEDRDDQEERRRRTSTAPPPEKTMRRSTRAVNSVRDTDLAFSDLTKFCSSVLFIRRNNIVRDHLGELKDHRIVEFDATGNKIKCLVDLGVCKKFLAYVEPSSSR